MSILPSVAASLVPVAVAAHGFFSLGECQKLRRFPGLLLAAREVTLSNSTLGNHCITPVCASANGTGCLYTTGLPQQMLIWELLNPFWEGFSGKLDKDRLDR